MLSKKCVKAMQVRVGVSTPVPCITVSSYDYLLKNGFDCKHCNVQSNERFN